MSRPRTQPAPHVRIWRQPDGLWRWRYVEPGPDGVPELTLTGHRAYESADEAQSSAGAAYPGIAVHYESRSDPHPAAPGRVPWWLAVALLVLILVVRHRVRRAGGHHPPS
jgi:ubiquinol-cytochrome c reductase cytochrome b subunit